MKCSRCSGEGKAERDLGHTAPTVTPPHRNLREERKQWYKEMEEERAREKDEQN